MSSPSHPPEPSSAGEPGAMAAPGTVAAPAPSPPPRRPGELTPGWRMVMLFSWVGVVLALAAVWNTSAQLGLSTWWLGPRAEPRPLLVQLGPFVAPMLMILGTVNHARWLGWFGLAAASVVGAVAVGDLGRVTSLAVVELLIAGAAAAVSAAALTGTYRRAG